MEDFIDKFRVFKRNCEIALFEIAPIEKSKELYLYRLWQNKIQIDVKIAEYIKELGFLEKNTSTKLQEKKTVQSNIDCEITEVTKSYNNSIKVYKYLTFLNFESEFKQNRF